MKQDISIKEVIEKISSFLNERDWQKFHDPKNLAMSIAIEAGELMEIFQWQTNAEAVMDASTPATRARIEEELADVMLYCLSMARLLKIDVLQAMVAKIAKNAERYPADRFRGVARKYDEPE